MLPSNATSPALTTGDLLVSRWKTARSSRCKTTDNGSIAWSSPARGLPAPVAFAADESAIYVTTGDSRVVALTRASGMQMWRVTIPGTLSPPAVGKDRVFVGSTRNMFVALNASNGKMAWRWTAEMIGGDIVGAAVDGDVTFFVGLDNLLHAVNRSNGNQRWKQPTPTRPIAPPLAFGGVVAVFGVSPAVATFDARTGTPIGTYVVPAEAGARPRPTAARRSGPAAVPRRHGADDRRWPRDRSASDRHDVPRGADGPAHRIAGRAAAARRSAHDATTTKRRLSPHRCSATARFRRAPARPSRSDRRHPRAIRRAGCRRER